MRKWFDAGILLYALLVSALGLFGAIAIFWAAGVGIAEAFKALLPFAGVGVIFWYTWDILGKVEREARQRMHEHE